MSVQKPFNWELLIDQFDSEYLNDSTFLGSFESELTLSNPFFQDGLLSVGQKEDSVADVAALDKFQNQDLDHVFYAGSLSPSKTDVESRINDEYAHVLLEWHDHLERLKEDQEERQFVSPLDYETKYDVDTDEKEVIMGKEHFLHGNPVLEAADTKRLLIQFEATQNQCEAVEGDGLSFSSGVAALEPCFDASKSPSTRNDGACCETNSANSVSGDFKTDDEDVIYNKIPNYFTEIAADESEKNSFGADRSQDFPTSPATENEGDELMETDEGQDGNLLYSKLPPYMTDLGNCQASATPEKVAWAAAGNSEISSGSSPETQCETIAGLEEKMASNELRASTPVYCSGPKHRSPFSPPKRCDADYANHRKHRSNDSKEKAFISSLRLRFHEDGGHSSEQRLRERLFRQWIQKDERLQQVDDRRIVYVGNISENVTKESMRKRFTLFGPVEDVSLHFRERGDNYGFVTFCKKEDAFEAIEHGNDDPRLPRYELCFGGRRHFCQAQYADLDNTNEQRFRGRACRRESDFDALLKAAKAKIQDR